MKKILLSSLAVFALASASLASELKLYTDEKGQVFTKPAKGRVELKTATPWYSHADKLKFSVQTFLGYKYNDYKDGLTSDGTTPYKTDTSAFEIRRAYFQVKAYMMEDPKSYYRVTFDVHQDTKKDGSGTDGDMVLRAKYAYVYFNDVLPATGVEIGLAHRPWHDYEEHNAWYFRNISKVLVEQGNGANLSNSADFGFMFKTKTKYFDADYGLYNGEGYHSTQVQKGMSFEWRMTGHLLGVNGKDKEKEVRYWDVSFFGQYNKDHKEIIDSTTNTVVTTDDLVFGGLHTVYNQPDFLVAAQYVYSLDTRDKTILGSKISAQAGRGYSVNAEYRMGNKENYRLLARYDSWTPKVEEKEQRTYIAGFAWDQNRNVEWVVNVDVTDNEKGSSRENYNGIAYMLTAEVKF